MNENLALQWATSMNPPQPNGAGGIVQCPKTISKVIGADGKVYCNECWASAMGTHAVANAMPDSPCLPEGLEQEFISSFTDKSLAMNGIMVLALVFLIWLFLRR